MTKAVHRVRVVDEDADLERVRRELRRITEAVVGAGENSPLGSLASEYRHSLVVTEPMKARIQDPGFTLERLYTCLMAPEP